MSRRTIPKKVFATAIGLGLALLAGELGLRLLLFGGLDMGWSLRSPVRFADYQSDEDYFKLAILWRGAPASVPAPRYHPVLGWVSSNLDAEDLEHVDAAHSRGRRRVLLYGDSYAHCVTPEGTCFEDAIERSHLAATHHVLNHGVQGYGLDQTTLMFEATIERYAPEDPIVLLGVLVDDDLDRCALTLRGYPKPRFELAGGELLLTGVPVPAMERYLEEHPLEIRSYLGRLLSHRPEFDLVWGDDHDGGGKGRLASALIARIARELESRELRGVVVLFEGMARTAAEEEIVDWRLETLFQSLREQGLPYVRTRDVLRARAAELGCPVATFFEQEGPLADHFTAEGNAFASAAIIDAIEGRFH